MSTEIKDKRYRCSMLISTLRNQVVAGKITSPDHSQKVIMNINKAQEHLSRPESEFQFYTVIDLINVIISQLTRDLVVLIGYDAAEEVQAFLQEAQDQRESDAHFSLSTLGLKEYQEMSFTYLVMQRDKIAYNLAALLKQWIEKDGKPKLELLWKKNLNGRDKLQIGNFIALLDDHSKKISDLSSNTEFLDDPRECYKSLIVQIQNHWRLTRAPAYYLQQQIGKVFQEIPQLDAVESESVQNLIKVIEEKRKNTL